MFERFSDEARRVVVLGQEEARRFNHDFIGTEHLLLGLVRVEGGLAARVLGAAGMSLDGLRTRLEEIIGAGSSAPQGHIPFTPRAKRCLELALRRAQDLDHDWIGTEHILLGILDEGEGVGAQMLQAEGQALEALREAVLEEIEAQGPALTRAPREAAGGPDPSGGGHVPGARLLEPELSAVLERLDAIEGRLRAIEELLRRRDEGA